MTQITPLKPGDTVRFTFGCTDTNLFGTLQRFTKDRQGRPAALIGVAGFPHWNHVEPLANVTPCTHRTGFASFLNARRFLAGNVPSACMGNCSQGRACTCERAEVMA